MATITKNRARKVSVAGPPSVGYVELTYPLLASRKHVTITVGDHVMRVELADAVALAKRILDIAEEYGK